MAGFLNLHYSKNEQESPMHLDYSNTEIVDSNPAGVMNVNKGTVKLLLELKYHAMKTYGGMEVPRR
jgi:hypothetical protein